MRNLSKISKRKLLIKLSLLTQIHSKSERFMKKLNLQIELRIITFCQKIFSQIKKYKVNLYLNQKAERNKFSRRSNNENKVP